jgi:hypothetical protein
MRAGRVAAAVACAAAIVAVNFYLCRGLFAVEFTGHTNSIQGLWIAMGRLAGEHWFRPAWWPYQDAGVPFEHTYMPLVPAAGAIASRVAHVSNSRGFFTVMGLVLVLGPLTLFAMLWRMGAGMTASFWSALAYSITSPARAVLPETDVDPIRYWSSHRIYNSIVWDDLPHHTAMLFFPLAVLALWRSFETRRPGWKVAAVGLCALTTLASVFGATALGLAVVCILIALPREQFRANLRLAAALGGTAYLIVSPFLPPSLIATIRSNQQRFVEDRWSAGSLIALGIVAAGCAALAWALHRAKAARHVRFFVLFGFVAASIPILDAHVGSHFVPQPNRYAAELEVGAAMLLALAIARASARVPRRLRVAVALFAGCVAVEQAAFLRVFTERNTRPVEARHGIEYRIAKWMEEHVPEGRVMVPGSIAQWFNVFTDRPQLSGASYSTTPNWSQHEAMFHVLTSTSADVELAVLWLKAFGVQAATVAGRQSPEFWKGNSSTKFDGLLPVLWRGEDTTIYRVPQRSPSLAHVVPESAVGELRRYVSALADASLPLATMRWDGHRRATIEATLQRGQVVSVQTGYHRGWHARANGRASDVRRDGLGLLTIAPACEGPCRIELTYSGGWEYVLCRALSALAILGTVAYAISGRRRRAV